MPWAFTKPLGLLGRDAERSHDLDAGAPEPLGVHAAHEARPDHCRPDSRHRLPPCSLVKPRFSPLTGPPQDAPAPACPRAGRGAADGIRSGSGGPTGTTPPARPGRRERRRDSMRQQHDRTPPWAGPRSRPAPRGLRRRLAHRVELARPAPAPGPGPVVALDASNFDAVASADGVCLVEFFHPACSHCRNMEPVVERLATDFDGRAVVGKVDVTASAGARPGLGRARLPHLRRGQGRARAQPLASASRPTSSWPTIVLAALGD